MLIAEDVKYNLDTLSNSLEDAARSGSSDLPGQIRGALTSFLSHYIFYYLWIGLIFAVFAFVFYGAFLYFTAYGDENRALQAKKTITYAFIGLAIGAAAMGIASYVNNILVNKEVQEQLKTPTEDPASSSSTGSTTGGT